MSDKNVPVGKGVGFERIRRITGYLVGGMDRWNDAKRAEEKARLKHSVDNRLSESFPPPPQLKRRKRRKRK